MSDPRAQAGGSGHWVPSPLLLKPDETPRFLRAAWDQKAAHAFGPWRVGAPADPALPLHELAPGAHAGAGDPGMSVHPSAHPSAGSPGLPAESPDAGVADVIDVPARAAHDADLGAPAAHPEALAEAEGRGHARGLAEGRAQALAEVEAERAREAELIRHLSIELRALSEDADRFFEPLRRLALHIAEQLVRGELQASPQAITQIVRQALAALDPAPGDPVLVCLHPEDAAMLEGAAPSFLAVEGLKIQPDPQLHRGSVRLRLDDTVLEDLVEHRLQALVERLLVHPGGAARSSVAGGDATATARDSVLLREFNTGPAAGAAAADPLGAGLRRRPARLDDVIDTTARPMPDAAGEEPTP